MDRHDASGDQPDLARLGAAVRAQRHALGLTQTQLGARLTWSQERVSALECGQYGLPTLPTMSRLARALELSLAVLITAAGFELDTHPADPARRRIA